MNPLSHYSQEALAANEDAIRELLDALDMLCELHAAAGMPNGPIRNRANDLLTRYAHMRKP